MKNLRKYIRKILLESPEMQADLEELVFNREDRPYEGFGPSDSTSHRDYAAAQTGDTSDRYKKYTDLRREVKAFWNEHADHSFWNKEVAALHDLGYYGGTIANTFNEDAELKAEADLSLASFIKKYPVGQRQKDEMSAYGCLNSEQEIATKMKNDDILLCVKLEGVVTYASAWDSFTESRSEATESDRARHKGSGMPKRPAVDSTFRSSYVLFDKEDLDNRRGEIGELVIDNWTWNTVYVKADKFPQHYIRDLKKLCERNNAKLVQV